MNNEYVIEMRNITKVFPGIIANDKINIALKKGEILALLGENGAGKTTLFKLIAGVEKPDSGEVIVGPTVKEAWVDQHRDCLDAEKTVFDEISDGLDDIQFGKYKIPSRSYCGRFGFKGSDQQKKVGNLSGGERNRVHLAKIVKSGGNLLMLDEPTNDIDVNTLRALEEGLENFAGCAVVISHDRWFLDTVAQRCIEIRDGQAEFYSGNYSFYVTERQRRFEEQLKKYEKDQAKYEQLKRAAEQMHLWAFMGNDKLHKRAFSMEKRIERLSHSEKPTEQKKLTVKFRQREFSGDEVLVIDEVAKSFGTRQLFSRLCSIDH